ANADMDADADTGPAAGAIAGGGPSCGDASAIPPASRGAVAAKVARAGRRLRATSVRAVTDGVRAFMSAHRADASSAGRVAEGVSCSAARERGQADPAGVRQRLDRGEIPAVPGGDQVDLDVDVGHGVRDRGGYQALDVDE